MAKAQSIKINLGSLPAMAGFGVVAVLAAVLLLWVYRSAIAKTVEQASKSGTNTLHNIIGTTRDINEDSKTVGSRSWAAKQIDDFKEWLGITDEAGPDLYEQGIYERTPPTGELPAFNEEGQIILPYGATPYRSGS